jgi:hypothetical protein
MPSSSHSLRRRRQFENGRRLRRGQLLRASVTSLLAAFALTGCYSAKKRVARNFRDIQMQWQTNVARQVALPEQVLNWEQAVARLEAGNLKLRRARMDITNAQENVRQVFKDLLPTINLRSGVSKTLESLPATSIDDVTFNIDSFFNIPGFVSMGTRLFAGRLVLLRAQAMYELGRREQTIELYKLFLSFQDSMSVEAQLNEERNLARAIEQVDPLAGQILLRDLETRELTLAKERDSFQDKAGDIFGNRDWRWILVTTNLPTFDYDANPLPVADTNRIAQLQMKLAAIEFVGAWARIKGVQLQYWPDLTLFITGPPLYRRSGNQESFWDAGQVRANANFFWRLDTRGQVSRQLRQTRRDQEIQLARLRQDAVALIDKILAAQKLVVVLRQEADQLTQLTPLLGQIPPAADYTGILKANETARSLRDQERKLRRELAELNTLFWFVDDAKWPRAN